MLQPVVQEHYITNTHETHDAIEQSPLKIGWKTLIVAAGKETKRHRMSVCLSIINARKFAQDEQSWQAGNTVSDVFQVRSKKAKRKSA
jgi:hypothetical protein